MQERLAITSEDAGAAKLALKGAVLARSLPGVSCCAALVLLYISRSEYASPYHACCRSLRSSAWLVYRNWSRGMSCIFEDCQPVRKSQGRDPTFKAYQCTCSAWQVCRAAQS